MAIPILFELNVELSRLFVAGSRLSSGDPRIKKFIAPLKKYGEKVPVFSKLAEQVEELSSVEANKSAAQLIETELLLLSVLSTQGNSAPEEGEVFCDLDLAGNASLGPTAVGYRTLAPVIEALTTTGSGRYDVLEQAFENGAFADMRLYLYAVAALGDKYGEIAEFMADKVLPSMGFGIYPFLMDGYDPKGGVSNGRRLCVMHKIKGEQMLALVDEAAAEGSQPVKVEAVKIMGEYRTYEETLLSMLDENKAVREEVMKALVKLGSKKGIDKLIASYKGSKPESVLDALSHGEGEYVTAELLKVAHDDYEAIKSADATDKAVEKFKNDILSLKNKKTDETVAFFKLILSEQYLEKAESLIAKDKKSAYYYKTLEEAALEALYFSDMANDFVWDMFKETQVGIFDKIFKGKKKGEAPKALNSYAFAIGATKLSPDEFYNMFFKTGLYKDIYKNDYHAFSNTFLDKENPLPYSQKIAHYFAQDMGDNFHRNLALRIVRSDDVATLNILAGHLRDILKKNTYYYNSYEILTKLGEYGQSDFKELFDLYCAKYPNSSEIEELRQFIK